MKNLTKIIIAVVCSTIFLCPTRIYAEEILSYEITFGETENASVRIASTTDSLIKEGYFEYIHSLRQLKLVSNAKFYHFAPANNSQVTIVVNGENEIGMLDRHGYYKIEGEGVLTIKGLSSFKQKQDKDGNLLYRVSYQVNGTSFLIKNQQKENYLVTSEKDIEENYAYLKGQNPNLPDQYAYTSIRLIPEYYYAKQQVEKDWVVKHIETNKKILYENDQIIIKEKEEQKEETVQGILENKDMIFESSVVLDPSYKLESMDLTNTLTEEEKEKLTVDNKQFVALYDISVLDGNGQVVPMEDGTFKLKIKISEDIKAYDNFLVAYIEDGEIIQTFHPNLDGDYLEFKTTHLSKYAILAEKISTGNSTPNSGNQIDTPNNIENPNTYDGIMKSLTIGIMGILGITCLAIYTNDNQDQFVSLKRKKS